jgi:hypothetical protein
LPSIADVIFIIILIFILRGPVNLLGDADTGYHIRAGEYIMANLAVPHYDIFSYISPPLAWTAHEWLSEVIFALIHKSFGLTGVVVVMALIIASVYTILLRFLKASGIGIIVSAFIVALATSASVIHWLARPHIFSLLITLIWYIVLDTYQYKHKNYLYLLPPIMLLWVNLHGGFIAGFLLFAVYITGNTFMAIFKRDDRQDKFGKVKKLLIFSFICILVTLINPKGYKILLFPFNLISNTFIMNNVNEFLSPNFHQNLRYEYMLLLMILVFGVSVLRLNAIEIMLVLLFTHMSLYSARYIPLYAIILSPILANQIDNILKEFKEKRLVKRILALSERTAKTDSTAKYHIWSIVTVLLIAFMVYTGKVQYEFNRKKLPVDAVQFLQKEKLKGNMFNNDEFGDFIIYSAWPEYKVFFDGRSDMYGENIGNEYLKITQIKSGWDDVLKKYNVNWLIFQTRSALSNLLLERNDWKLIYSDKVANIFVRNTPENQHLIDKYPDVKPMIVEDEENKDKEKK